MVLDAELAKSWVENCISSSTKQDRKGNRLQQWGLILEPGIVGDKIYYQKWWLSVLLERSDTLTWLNLYNRYNSMGLLHSGVDLTCV